MRSGSTQSTWTYEALTGNTFGTPDGSASVRWDPLHETDRKIIDTTFFDENYDSSGCKRSSSSPISRSC